MVDAEIILPPCRLGEYPQGLFRSLERLSLRCIGSRRCHRTRFHFIVTRKEFVIGISGRTHSVHEVLQRHATNQFAFRRLDAAPNFGDWLLHAAYVRLQLQVSGVRVIRYEQADGLRCLETQILVEERLALLIRSGDGHHVLSGCEWLRTDLGRVRVAERLLVFEDTVALGIEDFGLHGDNGLESAGQLHCDRRFPQLKPGKLLLAQGSFSSSEHQLAKVSWIIVVPAGECPGGRAAKSRGIIETKVGFPHLIRLRWPTDPE